LTKYHLGNYEKEYLSVGGSISTNVSAFMAGNAVAASDRFAAEALSSP
jgi:hypothetical protein